MHVDMETNPLRSGRGNPSPAAMTQPLQQLHQVLHDAKSELRPERRSGDADLWRVSPAVHQPNLLGQMVVHVAEAARIPRLWIIQEPLHCLQVLEEFS